MHLIKRHLIAAVLLLLGVGAIAGGVIYMLDKQTQGDEATQKLVLATNQLFAVTGGMGARFPGGAPMPPTPENVKIVADNTQAVRDFIAKAKGAIVAEPLPRLTPAAFGIHLAQTLNELKTAAADARVTYPTNHFEFSFYEHKGETQFLPYVVPPLIEQLYDIKTISTVLIQSRVAAIEQIERVSVSPKETKGAPTYLMDLGVYTNSVAVVAPYRFTVRGLSGALSRALVGLGSAPGFCVVKTVEVEPWDPNAVPAPVGFPVGIPMGLPGMNPPAIPGGLPIPAGVGIIRPVGVGVGVGVGLPGAPRPVATNLTPVARTVLDEKLLRVVLVIEISRPLPEQPKAVIEQPKAVIDPNTGLPIPQAPVPSVPPGGIPNSN